MLIHSADETVSAVPRFCRTALHCGHKVRITCDAVGSAAQPSEELCCDPAKS